MTEHSFFDFDSQPGDFERLDQTPWGQRFQDLAHLADENLSGNHIVEASFEAESLPTHGEIIELIETLHASESSPFARPATVSRPHVIHLPEHYEAGYAYPLVVWFHSDCASEKEVLSVMPEISERNYVGLALRGNEVCEQGYRWGTSADQLEGLIDDVESLVLSVRRQYHVHSERIYLAGFGSGASAAIELILQKPEWFGGAACLCGSFPELQLPADRFHDLRSKRILLGTTIHSRSSQVGHVVDTGRLLYTAGMQIGTRIYQDGGTGPTNKMLRDIDHWLMDEICHEFSS